MQFFLDDFWVGEVLRSVDELLVQGLGVVDGGAIAPADDYGTAGYRILRLLERLQVR